MNDAEYDARVALGTLLAVPSVHHPDQCDCSDDEWCEGLVDQVDAVIDAGWLPAAKQDVPKNRSRFLDMGVNQCGNP